MSPKDVIRLSLGMSDQVINAYISDLDDADLLVRPVPGMNHIAWQLGHLLLGERSFCEMIKPGSGVPLPEGFEASHGKDGAALDDPAKFLSRGGYQELMKRQREATQAVLDSIPESDLGKADPDKFPPYAPTVAALLNLCGTHPLMHCGQFVAVRRQLGKPVLI